ncbi:MAG: hypothetical protein COW00_08630 [Bdellovibrio sp. CG12_big_fil_rev_8_21_14_0_65_39_13]|nr:MAG: hypothetical protein COW78_08700 [Bdellovibrio sp. CG22_combo_CG10-13_8_21_14_all_39_27]PIQ59690.1 MAG: hypothetical protein COW00_08630 [Bdellovibrio sp. CG12_big_fil_rev_8_21_14_0_65_39_13]PIR36279.1 MAG: hypothetical protein COV37_04755 [Bdellovibrio sp. CG11_big_fil_rev_8_21_14_0_20_39_38]
MKKTITSLTVLATTLLSMNVHADRVKMLDPVMATISPSSQLTGPIFRNNAQDKQKYGPEMAKIILKEAHGYAKRYLEYGDTQGYYTLMVLALTVPMHEGLYVHFREIENDKSACRDELNTGKNIKSKTAQKNFEKAFTSGSSPFLSKCKNIKKENTIRQLIAGGGDGSDIGVMQLSSRWHYDEFLAKHKFANVQQTVNYGLSHLMKGFKPIYANFANYECLKNSDGSINRESVIRGAWAGIYNSGNLGLTCRFADAASAHAGKDIGFMKNLQKTYGLAQGGAFGYGDELALGLDSDTRAALEEVTSNFQNGTNNRAALDKLLSL